MAAVPHDHYKILVIGEAEVGKTDLMSKFVKGVPLDDSGDDSGPTTDVDYTSNQVSVSDGKLIKVNLWNTAGQERYSAKGNVYFSRARGACLVYDVTNRSTFEHVKTWFRELKEIVGPPFVATLVGNMVDLVEGDVSKREVDYTEALDFAKQNNLKFYETNAKTGHNVANVFENLVDDIYRATCAIESDRTHGGTGGAMFNWNFRRRNSKKRFQQVVESFSETRTSSVPASLCSPEECAEKKSVLAPETLSSEKTFESIWRRIRGCLCRQRQ